MNGTLAYFSYHRFPEPYAHPIQILKMSQAFQKAGYETTLFLCPSTRNAPISDQELFNQNAIKCTFKLEWCKFSLRKWLWRLQVTARTLLRCHQFDICYTRNFLAAFACLLARKECIFEVHAPSFPRLEELLSARLFRSDKIQLVTISDKLADLLANKYDVPKARIIVEHDAFDGDDQDTNKLPDYLISDKFDGQTRAVYIGSFYPGRGVELVIKMAKSFPSVAFIAVGGDHNDLNSGAAEIPDNFHVFGRVSHEKVKAVMRKADILLMPYENKVTILGKGNTASFASPLKLFEYLGAGKPILASRLPSISEVLEDHKNALLCVPGDIDSWVLAMETLLLDAELQKRLSAGALRTSKMHTWDERVRRILTTSKDRSVETHSLT